VTARASERAERTASRATAKFEARRAELADSAIMALAESGYANTSLRDIAQNSDFSHGVLHYYFRDKLDLISYCVRQYEAACLRRYDDILATSTTDDQLRQGFICVIGETLLEDASLHRLWYDLRAQSLFEDALREAAVNIDQTLALMIWRVVTRYAELAGRPVAVTEPVAYALFDGLFQRSLLQLLAGDQTTAVTQLRQQADIAFDLVLEGKAGIHR